MSKLYRLILGENCTIPNGTAIELIPVDHHDRKNETSDEDDYNAVGAMEFIVATILLYSILGVFCTLLIKIKRSRGKSYFNNLMDESVTKYLKQENSLKFDGQRSSMMRACRQVSMRLEEFEQKQSWLDTELEGSSEINQTDKLTTTTHKKLKKKRRRKRKEEDWLPEDIEIDESQYLAPGQNGQEDALEDGVERTRKASMPESYTCVSLESREDFDTEPSFSGKCVITDI